MVIFTILFKLNRFSNNIDELFNATNQDEE